MKRRYPAFVLCLLLICSVFIPISLGGNVKNIPHQPVSNSRGNTLYVGGSGGDNYTLIQDAIDNATSGDTVFVYDDSSPYKELVVIDKSINLIGEDRNTTVIDGNYKGTVVDIREDNVLVTGFTVTECKKKNTFQYNAINIIGCSNVVIIDNIITLGSDPMHNPAIAGVYLQDTSYNIIKSNIIFDDSGAPRTNGILLYENSYYNNITGNEIYGYVSGIDIKPTNEDNIFNLNYLHNNCLGIENCGDKNTYINNVIDNNKYQGFRNDDASNNIISGNSITNNGEGGEFEGGIHFVTGGYNEITNNHISNNNPTGVFLLSEYNIIKSNHISDNKIVGIYADFEYKSTISMNNLIENPTNAYFKTVRLFSSNRWNKNYYDDYSGRGIYVIHGAFYFIIFTFNWINIDWNPASEPYDIEV